MQYKNLTIIGTSHIAKQSVNEVRRVIAEKKPAVVAIELDRNRYAGLVSGEESRITFMDIRHIGIKGYIFALIGAYVEKKLGNIVNVRPGADMLAAAQAAQENKARVALIDQDIAITLQKFSKRFTWREKWNFFVDFIYSFLFRKKAMKRFGISNLDLSKVPEKEVIRKMIGYVQMRYPNLYFVLIQERNYIMAAKLHKIMEMYPENEIVAVVGAGHEEEIVELLKQKE